jgi:[citrate (pro-3S)-lyase] ligase
MEKQAELDVRIFARYVVPVLGIRKRYIGTEKYCLTTAAYNKAMKDILPSFGVEVIEVMRMVAVTESSKLPIFISASNIRQAIKEDRLDEVAAFMPESTREFLHSDDSLDIRLKIKAGSGRH